MHRPPMTMAPASGRCRRSYMGGLPRWRSFDAIPLPFIQPLLESAASGGHWPPNAALGRGEPITLRVMRAVLRGKLLLLGIGLAASSAALGQPVPDATTNAPASNTTMGPRELQNFSLPGTPAKPADQTPAAPTTGAPQTATTSPAPAPAPETEARRSTTQPERSRPAPAVTAAPPFADKVQLPSATPAFPTTAPAVQTPTLAPVSANPVPTAPVEAPTSHHFSILPWLAAALALAGGALFLLWRRRSREAYAGVADFEPFTAVQPEPLSRQPAPPVERAPAAAPTQAPIPAPTPASGTIVSTAFKAPSAPAGIVSSRLRPALEIVLKPLRCTVDDREVTIEFELELFNAGTAPARAVHAEAGLMNASATQDQELAAFFANPSPHHDRLDVIPPMKRIQLTSRVVAPRSSIQEYELAGRKSFVPLIAFNALYQWSGGSAQTSAAYLVGRETNGEKLGPLRLDALAREMHGLGARELPVGIRS